MTDWLHDDTVFFPSNTALLLAPTTTRMRTLREWSRTTPNEAAICRTWFHLLQMPDLQRTQEKGKDNLVIEGPECHLKELNYPVTLPHSFYLILFHIYYAGNYSSISLHTDSLKQQESCTKELNFNQCQRDKIPAPIPPGHRYHNEAGHSKGNF